MKIRVGLKSNSESLPSSHQIGDRVKLQPDISKINADGTCMDGTYAEVVRIGFDAGKVVYDLAVINPNNNQAYYAYPMCNVDSVFVSKVNMDGFNTPVPSTEVSDTIAYLDSVLSFGQDLKSESKGKSKKPKSPRQMLYSVMMREMAGVRGEELAQLMVDGNEEKLQEEFGKSVTNMLKDFKKKVK